MVHDEYAFPGRWVTGACMVTGPLVLLAGMLLRLPFHFFFPRQLEAFAAHPVRVHAAYGCIAIGTILLAPAVIGLSTRIGRTRPAWATIGGTLVLSGLFARTFHAGVDHFALQLVPAQGVESATRAVGTFYGATHPVMTLTPAILFGWIVLAAGAWRSGVFGAVRAIALASMSALMIGVLKGTAPSSVVATAGLCVAFVPEGIAALRQPPHPRGRVVAGCCVATAAVIAACFVLGGLG
jgi:hypothetical protein